MATKDENKKAQDEKNPETQGEPTAQATPEDEQVPPILTNTPESNMVGVLEFEVNPDSMDEAQKQQAENYPRRHVQEFDPHDEERELEPERSGFAATHRSVVGRVVVVEEDTPYEGEVIKAGVQDLPIAVADALIAEGDAWEPAGKKRGR